MKKSILLAFLLIGGIFSATAFRSADEVIAPAEGDGINYFKGTFADAVKLSEKSKKPIFFDAYTDWCGWCKRLDANTFSKKEVYTYMNDNFINVKMNMESPEGSPLVSRYRVMGYPTLLFINGKGEAFHRIGGYAEPAAFLAEAQKAMELYKR